MLKNGRHPVRQGREVPAGKETRMSEIAEPLVENEQAAGDILVVDDNPDNLRVLSMMLTENDYKVRPAPSGPLALRSAGSRPPDLILLDINMPEMNGYEVCRKLKENPVTAHVPVIFISALDDTADKVKAFKAGGVDYINKPFHLQEVLARVKVHVSLREAQQRLSERNEHLQEIIGKLEETQQELVETRKMASLGNLVTGIAHEINTPVGVGITSASFLVDVTEKIEALLGEGDMKYSDLTKYLGTCRETSQFILTNLQKTGELIQGFKQVSVDQYPEKRIRFNLNSYLRAVMGTLALGREAKKARIRIDCSETLEILSYQDAFEQILTNLFGNAILHGFHGKEKGTITLEANREEGQLHLLFRDDGAGIEEEILPRIFDPFFTTNKQTGTGLGLHVVFNIITQKLGGSIQCESVPGEGAAFSITLPLETEEVP